MKTLILFLTILTSFSTIANNKDGGNGQLVVVMKGHKNPVPYEAARAWETGKYLNFYRLPNINGNIEPREKFNRYYAVHALEWLELIKKLSPILHQDLIQAATNTSFRIVNELITWKHQPYPDGEVKYKSYQKAAYYNGEIIFSTPIMDKIGPLKDRSNKVQLTAAQNQGFILVHELINASYPNFTVAEKLKIGEALIRAKIFNDSEDDVHYNLATVSPYFLTMLPDLESFTDLVDELIRYEKDQEKRSFLFKVNNYAKEYAYTNSVLSEVVEKNVINLKLKNANEITIYLKDIHRTLNEIGFTFKQNLITLESLKNIATSLNLVLADLLVIVDPVSKKSFLTEGQSYIDMKFKETFFSNIDELLKPVLTSSDGLTDDYFELLIRPEEESSFVKHQTYEISKKLIDKENLGFNNNDYNYIQKFISENYLALSSIFKKAIENHYTSKGIFFDLKKTINHFTWQINKYDPINAKPFPFATGDKFITPYYKHLRLYNVIDVDSKNKMITTRDSTNEKIKFALKDSVKRKTYSIGNIDRVLFLDLERIKSSGFDIENNPLIAPKK